MRAALGSTGLLQDDFLEVLDVAGDLVEHVDGVEQDRFRSRLTEASKLSSANCSPCSTNRPHPSYPSI